jgi:hypothetical protein
MIFSVSIWSQPTISAAKSLDSTNPLLKVFGKIQLYIYYIYTPNLGGQDQEECHLGQGICETPPCQQLAGRGSMHLSSQ